VHRNVLSSLHVGIAFAYVLLLTQVHQESCTDVILHIEVRDAEIEKTCISNYK
jgi:hypothetical protein